MSEKSTAESNPATGPRRTRWRLWLKRIVLTLVGVLLVLAVFHRPLLRWTADRVAHHFAAKGGYKLDWRLEGSMLSNLTLTQVRVEGPADGVVKSIRWENAGAKYSLVRLLRQGVGQFLNEVELKDAEVVLDLRQLKPKRENPPTKRKGLPDFWLGQVELRNVTVRAMTDNGEILLKNLTLVLKEGHTGEMSLAELVIPQRALHFENVSAVTSLKDRWIRFEKLKLMPELEVEHLALNVANLKSGDLPLELKIRSGEGQLETHGSLKGVGREKLALDLDLLIERLRDSEIRRWVALPPGMTWQVERLSGKVAGLPGEPRALNAQLQLHATSFVMPKGQLKLDELKGVLEMKAGQLELSSWDAKSGANGLTLEGRAVLPERWKQIARSDATVKFGLDAPTLHTLTPGTTLLKGGIKGGGTVAVKDALLAGADLQLQSSDLSIGKVALSDLQVEVASDARAVTIKAIKASLNDQTDVVVTGDVKLEGRQHAALKLRLRGEDLSLLTDLKEWLNVYPPASGVLEGEVDAQFDVADLKEKDYRKIQAEGRIGVTDLKWNQGSLEKGAASFGFKENQLEIRAMNLDFDSQNTLHLAGDLSLDPPRPVNASWKADLAQISTLTSWLQSESLNTLPPPQSGAALSEGRASFNLADLKSKDYSRLAATVTLGLKEVQWLNAVLEDASLDAEVQQGRVTTRTLNVKLNTANQVRGNIAMDLAAPNGFTADLKGDLTNLPDLSGWLELFKGPAIDSGAVAINWTGSGKLKPLEVKGNGAVKLKEFSMAGNPNRYDLDLETRHEGRRAELTRLVARAGKFRLEAAGSVSDTDLEMTQFTVKSDAVSLVTGKASIPLVLDRKPRPKVPVDDARPLAVELEMKKLKFEELFAALGKKVPPVTGTAEGTVSLNGRLSGVKGKVDLSLGGLATEAMKGKLEPANVRLRGGLESGKLTVEAEAVQRPLRPMLVKASLPLQLDKVLAEPSSLQDAPLQAEVNLPESDLSFVPRLVPTVERVQGTVVGNVKLEGPLRRPSWRGQLRLNVPSAELAKGQMSVRDVRANLSFVEKKITLEDVSAILAGGEIRASGGVNVEDLLKPDINVNVVAKQALIVRDDTMSVRADGNLAIRGPLNEASVSGRVELVRGRVFKEIEFLPLSLPDQLPPPPPPVKARAKPSAPPPFDKWKLDVKVVTRDPIRLLGNVLNGGVVADLHVGGTGANPEVTGRSTAENARVQLPFSRLNITRGNLVFTKERPLDPELDLQGDSLVGNYMVTLYAYGPALKPKVRFTSNPPLSEGEIATLLATGSSAGDLTSSEGVAANRAAFLLLSQTYRKLFRKAAPKRLDEEPPKLTFSFSPLSTGNTQRAVTATYEINPRLQAIGEVSERGTFRGLLHYLVRFR